MRAGRLSVIDVAELPFSAGVAEVTHRTHVLALRAVSNQHPHVLAASDAECVYWSLSLAARADSGGGAGDCNVPDRMLLWPLPLQHHVVDCFVVVGFVLARVLVFAYLPDP